MKLQKLQDFKTILAAIYLLLKIDINLKILEKCQELFEVIYEVFMKSYLFIKLKSEVINVEFLLQLWLNENV